jgi:hypothetical protein
MADHGAWLYDRFLEHEGAIKAHAIHRQNTYRNKCIDLGRSADEMEYRALINWAWQRLLEGRPRWDPSIQTLGQYFIRRIDGRVANLCRDPVVPRFHLSVVENPVDGPMGRRTILAKDIEMLSSNGPEDDILRRDLTEYIHKRKPHLSPLLSLYADKLFKPADQAAELGLEPQQVYKMTSELRKLVQEYISCSAREREGRR